VIIQGTDEAEKGTVMIKNMQTKDQKEIKVEEVANFLNSK
jgi:histidyl-tRNA synthetase